MNGFTTIPVDAIPKTVKETATTLHDSGYEALCVGGCVRDCILQRAPTDWDVATNAAPEVIESLFKHTFRENAFGTVTIVFDDEDNAVSKHIEVTSFRKEGKYSDNRRPDSVSFGATLEEDCARRDFTINALALNPLTGALHDFHNGVQDLSAGVVRAVNDPDRRFKEDALRLLRAVRIAGGLKFEIEKETLTSITAHKERIQTVAAERIRDELFRMVGGENPVYAFNLLYQTGLMDIILPDFVKGWGIEQNQAHQYDVFTHNLRTLEHAVRKNLPFHIRLAGFFHDIAKPHTRQWSEKKKDWTFYTHEVVGARITRDTLKRLKVPSALAKKVALLVRWHMFFSDTEKVTATGVRRLLARVGEDMMWELIDLRMCDRIGTGRPKENPYRLRQYAALVEEVLRDPITPGRLAIGGDDLMKELGLKPGKPIGHILNILLSESLESPDINTKEALLEQAKTLHTLDDKALESRGARAREIIQALSEREINAINKKYGVER